MNLLNDVGATLAVALNTVTCKQGNRKGCPYHTKINLGIVMDNHHK
jgi:hypothetical protein